MKKIVLGIFDDHTFFVKGLRDFLEQYDFISIIFTASNRDELEKALSGQLPEILIMDVLAPDVTGLELYINTLKTFNTLKIISYTSLKSDVLIDSLLSMGVKGYVNKNQPPADLLEAIKDVHYDLVSVPEEFRDLIPKTTKVKAIFTARESQIMKLIANGHTLESIAKELSISPRTAENIKLNLFKKLDVKNAPELILTATRLGHIS